MAIEIQNPQFSKSKNRSFKTADFAKPRILVKQKTREPLHLPFFKTLLHARLHSLIKSQSNARSISWFPLFLTEKLPWLFQQFYPHSWLENALSFFKSMCEPLWCQIFIFTIAQLEQEVYYLEPDLDVFLGDVEFLGEVCALVGGSGEERVHLVL